MAEQGKKIPSHVWFKIMVYCHWIQTVDHEAGRFDGRPFFWVGARCYLRTDQNVIRVVSEQKERLLNKLFYG